MSRAVELLEEENKALRAQLAAVRRSVAKLETFKPEMTPEHFTKNYGYSKGDEEAPFFTECFLYVLLGKEDARTLLALFGDVQDVCEVKPGEGKVYREMDEAVGNVAHLSYHLDPLRELFPKVPDKPVLDVSKKPAATKIPGKQRTAAESKQIEAWYESEGYRSWSKAYDAWRKHPAVRIAEAIYAIGQAENRFLEARKNVREIESKANVRRYFRQDAEEEK